MMRLIIAGALAFVFFTLSSVASADDRLNTLLVDSGLLAKIQQAKIDPRLRDSGPVIGYMTAPLRGATCANSANCRDIKAGYAKIQVIVVERSALVDELVLNGSLIRLPSEYYPALEERLGRPNSGIRRAQCDAVTLTFSNMGDKPFPVGPYPISDHEGNYRNLPMLAPPIEVADGLGYPSMALPITTVVRSNGDVTESRAVRVHVPNELLTRAKNPVMAIQVWHKGKRVPILFLPTGISVSNTMFSTPANAEKGRENALHLAAKNGHRAFILIVPEDVCS